MTKQEMIMDKPQPRAKYDFGEMSVNDVKDVRIPDDDPEAGDRARCAAYAYGRRNDQQFCGAVTTRRGKNYMQIRRVK
jgi:hypothetical protein